MPYQLTVSPDFSPDHLSGWYIFNTWLQRQIGEAIHLELYNSFQAQRDAIHIDKIDLIYANPFDAAMLVREKGFLPLVKVQGVSDEAIVAVNKASAITDVTELSPGSRIAVTEDPDVRLMGMIMLEPADLTTDNVQIKVCDSYVLVAKQLLREDADVGIFLAEAYDDLSSIIKKQLRILVQSQIGVIQHALLVGPRLAHRRDELRESLLAMNVDEKGRDVLKNLSFDVWANIEDEDMEFMIDLMDTLNT
ncbi:MAG: phosphate/phosphite/phosphonate ABC transporter substrate-binding protein [Methylobacter sp.]|nr:phosphate/phosphite/phosphonate ABC transporter substrate-binding protein [Methylococcales bacterium]MDD5112561.1 phosphate/phosphite/phosphonate ABC transporter substrate-binding protein [Methylobacter sp.]